MGKHWKQCQTLFLGAPKSLQMVIAAMKLKDEGYELIGDVEGETSIILLRDTLASPEKEKTTSKRKKGL